MKYVINAAPDSGKFFYVKSEQETPTLYFSFLPQYAHQLKEKERGIIYIGGNYILGLLGNNTSDEMVKELEALCKEMSTKPVKMTKKADVKFDFKIKGQKPVVTKEICQFNITGADFKEDKIVELMKKYSVTEME